MTLPVTDRTKLNELSPNLTPNAVAASALRLAVFQEIYTYLDAIISDLNAYQGAGAVGTTQLANLSVTSGKLADLAVQTGKIADLAVTTAKINDLAVTLAKMAANSVGSTQLVDLSVITSKINDLAVNTQKLENLSVTEAKLANESVTNAKLGPSSVSRDKVGIGAIGSSQLDPALLQQFSDAAVQAQIAELTQDADITVTVGSGGDFSTINAALGYLSRKRAKSGVTAEIRLLSGFVMSEQVLVRGTDLGWIKITSVDAVVTITRSALTSSMTIPAFGGSVAITVFPAFGGMNNAVLPVISALFDMDATGTASNRTAFFAGNGSQITIEQGKGCTHAGGQGLFAAQGGRINAGGANVSYAGGNAISCFRGAYVSARDSNLSHAGGFGIYADNVSFVDASNADVSYAVSGGIWSSGASIVGCNFGNISNSAANGIQADNGSTVDAHNATIDNSAQRGISCNAASVIVKNASIKNSGADGINCSFGGFVDADSVVATGSTGFGISAVYGSRVNARLANVQKVVGTNGSDLRVLIGSTIVFNGGTGGISGSTANVVSENGIVYTDAVATEQVAITLQNGWTGTLYYGKNSLGQVWLRGTVTAGTVTTGTVFGSLPGGYRPSTAEFPFVAINGTGLAVFKISTGGGIQVVGNITTGNIANINTIFQT